MSPDSTPTEVFADVDPDPDAVLTAFDIDSPHDLTGDGAHDPSHDDDVTVDDTTAAELFADLQDVAADADPSARTDETDGDGDRAATPGFEFAGGSDVVVREDGDVIDSAATDLNDLAGTDGPPRAALEAEAVDEPGDSGAVSESGAADRTRTGGAAAPLTVRDGGTELELSGPEPTPVRIDDDAFGIDTPDTGP